MAWRFGVVAVLTALCPAAAAAQPITGLYLGVGAGINLWHDQASGNVRVQDEEIGVAAVAALGYGFGNGLRIELEGNFRSSGIDRITVGGAPAGGGGTIRNYGALANVLFDFDLTGLGLPPYAVRPYLGGGVGYGWLEIDGAAFGAGGVDRRIDDSDGAIAFQGIAGLAFGLEQFVPGLSVTVEYRYYGTAVQTLRVTGGDPSAGGPDRLRLRNDNQGVLLGLRYELSRPVAPPAPMPGPPAIRPINGGGSYLVFFDWDRADLSARAREIIGEAVVNARRVSTTRIEVAGHADRSGSAAYNQRLSQRRADAVVAELLARGVSRGEIAVTAFGERRPVVPTADGVREPQNRRVEIVLR